MLAGTEVPLDPHRVAHRRGRARHEEVAVPRQAGDRHVRLVAGTLVEHARVDGSPRPDGHVRRAEALEHRLRVPADHQELAEGGLVEDGHALPGRGLLGGRPGKPLGPVPGVVELCDPPGRGEHDRPLPPHLRAEDGPPPPAGGAGETAGTVGPTPTPDWARAPRSAARAPLPPGPAATGCWR